MKTRSATDEPAAITTRRRSALDPALLAALVDRAPTPVIWADRSLVIRYLNQASRETLERLQHLLPCPVDEMVGQTIDVFHKDPSMQRRLLADPRNLPHKARISLGDEVLDLLVSPIHDARGRYAGPMLTWQLVTE